VSGGAYGVDGTAHRAALAAGGITVAVLAGGLASPYPAGHAHLFDRVAATGLLVSESPSDCPPQRHLFLLRNRLIAAFASGTVVVEAGARSGTSSTVRRPQELGRPVMAVPGPVTSAQSVGCHRLLRAGVAHLVTSAGEVLGTLGAPTGEADLPPVTNRR
jgi:DNA processing protein